MTIGKFFSYIQKVTRAQFYDFQQENEITFLEIREKKAQKRREKGQTKQDDPINFPLSALNRELCHDSFQYSTNKKKTDSKQYFSNYGKLLQNFNILVLMG